MKKDNFNQLEELLDAIVDGKDVDDECPNLVFDLGDYLLIFSKDEKSYMCYLDCAAHDNYDSKSANYRQKFEFELPLVYINNFLLKHIQEPKQKTHFLLNYPIAEDIESVENFYNNLVEKINLTPKFFPAFLPGLFSKDLPINDINNNSKKLKL